ncbi:hypothetical protein MRB53_019289 [Persea americana]|uniref:Uncharacterized protein n=1 Tax=Persea americana TaxID=3435 RepID=A0ACC2KYS4_PERAE|nr:hypothetical protein MRB53_019289 [Persea americana]|eukprot:TRINITY_DN70328_c0_g1_i1.p1 TRINITY_DN70328_c0_g1~~TRINITY_DN70328_c0_g1_i1.p1  ORF type:complete len:240 (-),score=22.54 TRINITY_DN70328_c0_g1_i1:343-1062(-)
MTTTSLPWQPLLPSKPHLIRRSSPRHVAVIQAFRRSDFDGFAKRVASGEALKDAWRSANVGFEQLLFDAKRAAMQFDRRFSLSRRIDSAARSAADRAREIDRELGIGRWWRTFSMDFGRNWPRYRRDLSGFLETPLGKGSATIFFLWFALSGWLFRILILATWVLPFAAPLLIGTVANNFVIEGACPACKRRFMGYRNQVIQCASCRNIVWQPGNKSSRGARPSSNSESDIIDIEIEEK